ncbi:D-amino-acid transaminase [Pararhizobium sp. IMCC21322]|uniref:D-amino-acid transaminase n=1 Tax=Pararhizobium sp. IMCC21322 TaxID=3067903 RepID=UPI0027427F85|nr:D-amino-acid transaminase [Pararhizobium sp. IMCC21322]
MSRIAYVNGQYLPHQHASVHVEDRGYQFADGVYEVCEVLGGRLIDEKRHMERLSRSLRELRIPHPMTDRALGVVLREVVVRNKVRDGLIYLQVTRGVAPRNHYFPPDHTAPAIVVTARNASVAKSSAMAEQGVAVISLPDNRWDRVDIKSISLLPNVLAKQTAREQGAFEAWFVDDEGYVTEGSSTNAWIVTKDGTIVTRPAEEGILKGITRAIVLELAEREGMQFEERSFTIEEAQQAREAFITAATTLVMPVVSVDDVTVANGTPGHIATTLRSLFHSQAEIADT